MNLKKFRTYKYLIVSLLVIWDVSKVVNCD
jgi:hypothetical protein